MPNTFAGNSREAAGTGGYIRVTPDDEQGKSFWLFRAGIRVPWKIQRHYALALLQSLQGALGMPYQCICRPCPKCVGGNDDALCVCLRRSCKGCAPTTRS